MKSANILIRNDHKRRAHHRLAKVLCGRSGAQETTVIPKENSIRDTLTLLPLSTKPPSPLGEPRFWSLASVYAAKSSQGMRSTTHTYSAWLTNLPPLTWTTVDILAEAIRREMTASTRRNLKKDVLETPDKTPDSSTIPPSAIPVMAKGIQL